MIRKKTLHFIKIIAIVVVASVAFATSSQLSSYDIGYDVSLQLYQLGIFTNYTKGLSEAYLRRYLSEYTDATTMSLSLLQLVGAASEDGQPLDVTDNVNSVYYLKNIPAYVVPSLQQTVKNDDQSPVSSLTAYKNAFIILGYTEDEFGTTDDSILDFATSLNYGFTFDVKKKNSLTNGELAQILYETLFIKVSEFDAPFYRVRSMNDTLFKEKLITLGMYDDMPDLIPLFNSGIFQAGSFYGYLGENTSLNRPKNEWTASYIKVLQNSVYSYTSLLNSKGWKTEGEYEVEHVLDEENRIMSNIIILYKTADVPYQDGTVSMEIYCTLRYFPDLDLLEIDLLT